MAKRFTIGSSLPVDPFVCQADVKPEHNPWALGDPERPWTRCLNKASWVAIAIERERDRMGRYGAMSLCRTCRKVFCDLFAVESYTLSPAKPYQAAYLLGGHQAVKVLVYATADAGAKA